MQLTYVVDGRAIQCRRLPKNTVHTRINGVDRILCLFRHLLRLSDYWFGSLQKYYFGVIYS